MSGSVVSVPWYVSTMVSSSWVVGSGSSMEDEQNVVFTPRHQPDRAPFSADGSMTWTQGYREERIEKMK